MNPDPLYDALKRDIRSYHRVVQNQVIRRVQYDMMRYDAINTYMETKRQALLRSAKVSARALDESSEVATVRARLILDAAYEDISRDLHVLQNDIRALAEENKKALDTMHRIRPTPFASRPHFFSSFDVFH